MSEPERHPHPHHHHHSDEPCSGHDSDKPSSAFTVLDPTARGTVETTLQVSGMDCADEVEAIHQVLRPMPGIREVRVNLMSGSVTLLHSEQVRRDRLIDAINSTGLRASVATGSRSVPATDPDRRWRQIAVLLSGALTGIGLLFEWLHVPLAILPEATFALAIIIGSTLILPKAWRALRRLSLDMNVLMTVAVSGAIAIGQYSEGAAVTFLFALSELLEAFSLARARRAVQALMQLTPETAWLQDSSGLREVPVEQVPVGSIIAVKSGQRVPLDGVVTTGESTLDQAPITGESMPVEKKPGDSVFAGSINGAGSLRIQTTKAHSNTTIARIIHLVSEAQSQKAPAQRFVDSFARYYTPLVMVGALLVILLPTLLFQAPWLPWIYRGLVLLVIACPCALVISTPVSVVSGLTAMARRGVLIKGGSALEALGRIRALAMDKTGTITEGHPRVVQFHPLASSASEAELLRIAASIDTHSQHPLAAAVTTCATERGVAFTPAESYQALHGRGAEGTIDGHRYFVGNHRLAHELGLCTPDLEQRLSTIEDQALSVIVVGHRSHAECAGEILGILGVGDTIRPHAAEAIRTLHAAGVAKIIMLSGDNQKTASAIAAQAGIDEAHGDLLPDDKIVRVRTLTTEYTHAGMIGDGVNDAPAMAAASVAIAMGQSGTDTAIETADVALMKDDLLKVAEAVALGRRTLRIIQFNIGFALAIKALFLILALLGHTSLWLAILADTGATLLVIANSLRLLRSPVRE